MIIMLMTMTGRCRSAICRQTPVIKVRLRHRDKPSDLLPVRRHRGCDEQMGGLGVSGVWAQSHLCERTLDPPSPPRQLRLAPSLCRLHRLWSLHPHQRVHHRPQDFYDKVSVCRDEWFRRQAEPCRRLERTTRRARAGVTPVVCGAAETAEARAGPELHEHQRSVVKAE